jgi:hypothetical protein
MAGSNWNALLERLLAEKLTPNEYRAALAIARLTLGYRKTGRGLGRKWICETAGGMDGRSFDRARAGLVKKGLLRYEPGSIGKGHRGHYELVLDPSQKAHSDAPFEEAVKGAPRRAKSGTSKRRAGDTQKAHSDAPRIGKGKKNPSATPELQQSSPTQSTPTATTAAPSSSQTASPRSSAKSHNSPATATTAPPSSPQPQPSAENEPSPATSANESNKSKPKAAPAHGATSTAPNSAPNAYANAAAPNATNGPQPRCQHEHRAPRSHRTGKRARGASTRFDALSGLCPL